MGRKQQNPYPPEGAIKPPPPPPPPPKRYIREDIDFSYLSKAVCACCKVIKKKDNNKLDL